MSYIALGDNWQTKATAGAVGETFIVQKGVHRLQTVTPQTGQVFLGETGAIMSGAKLLTGPTGSNPWVYSGQTQAGTVDNAGGDACLVGHDPLCAQPEDVFIDNVQLESVASAAIGRPGAFFFDYAADTISIWDDPTGKTVETSVTPTAFVAPFAGPSGVIIQNLIIEKYASVTQNAAVNTGSGWILQNCELRYNHFSAVNSGTQSVVRHCYVHHNGAFGLNGSGSFILIEDNEIAYNNTAFYNPGMGAGGSKWVYTDNLTVRRNFSHHNRGVGLWTDINNIFTLYENNLVEDNWDIGIFHEVSYDAVIRNNIARRNGNARLFAGDALGAGIYTSSSRNVEMYGNLLVDNWEGIGGLDTGRSGEGENSGPWRLTNLYVHDNVVIQTSDIGAGAGISGVLSRDSAGLGTFLAAANNRFVNNTYLLGSHTNYFAWNDGQYNFAAWQGFGKDTPGSATVGTPGFFPIRVQQVSNSVFGANPNGLTLTFSGNVVAGNRIVIVVRAGTTGDLTGATDTVLTDYQFVVSDTTQDPHMWIISGVAPSAGANTITLTFSTINSNFVWAQAVEVNFYGRASQIGQAKPNVSPVGRADQVTQKLSGKGPAYLIMGAAVSNVVTYTTDVDSLGFTWALVNGNLGVTPNFFGGVQDVTTTGDFTDLIGHMISSDTSDQYTTVAAVFEAVPGPSQTDRKAGSQRPFPFAPGSPSQ